MTGVAGSTPGTGVRAGSLVIRRFGDTYQFELDVPSSTGGVRPGIWSGTQRIEPETWSALREALETTATGLLRREEIGLGGTATQVAPDAESALERLGGLIHRHVLPEEVQ